jgi:hypothetical protein
MRNTRLFNFIRQKVARIFISAITGENTLTKRKDSRNQASKSASLRFGACSIMARALKECLSPYLEPYQQGYYTRPATALFNRMAHHMDKEELKNCFDPKPMQHLLVGHQFYQVQTRNETRVRRKNFDHICKIPVHWHASPDRRTIRMIAVSFPPKYSISAPKSVTHFQLVILSGILLPVTYSAYRGKLLQDEPESRFAPLLTYSSEYELKREEGYIPAIELEQTRDYPVPEAAVVVVCLGIRFVDRRFPAERSYESDSRMKIAYVC